MFALIRKQISLKFVLSPKESLGLLHNEEIVDYFQICSIDYIPAASDLHWETHYDTTHIPEALREYLYSLNNRELFWNVPFLVDLWWPLRFWLIFSRLSSNRRRLDVK